MENYFPLPPPFLIPDSRPRRASPFASLRDLCENLFQILAILSIHVQLLPPCHAVVR